VPHDSDARDYEDTSAWALTNAIKVRFLLIVISTLRPHYQ
jgi:hypothetical protein